MASVPYKLNLVTIKIKQKQVSSSDIYTDPIFNEPGTPIDFGSEITLKGQVNFGSKEYEGQSITLTGDMDDTRGHLVFRNPVRDTSGTDITLGKGDLITEIAGVAIPDGLYIREVRPESPLDGAFLLWYVEFSSNPEIRESS